MSESQYDVELLRLRARVRNLEQKVLSLEAQLCAPSEDDTGSEAVRRTSTQAFADAWHDVGDETICTFFDAEYVDERARDWLVKDGSVTNS